LVDSIGIVMTKLMHDFGDPFMVAFGESRPNGGFETVIVTRQLCFTHTGHTHADCSPWCIHCTSFSVH
jgi:hypothetical protein